MIYEDSATSERDINQPVCQMKMGVYLGHDLEQHNNISRLTFCVAEELFRCDPASMYTK